MQVNSKGAQVAAPQQKKDFNAEAQQLAAKEHISLEEAKKRLPPPNSNAASNLDFMS